MIWLSAVLIAVTTGLPPGTGAMAGQLGDGMNRPETRQAQAPATAPAAPVPPLPPAVQPPLPVPDTAITGGPPPRAFGSSARFTFVAIPSGASFQCSLDDDAFTPCPGDATFTKLAPGAHILQVRATNDTGADATPAWSSWTTVAPGVDVFTGYSIAGRGETDRFPIGWTISLDMSVTRWFQLVSEGSGHYVPIEGAAGAHQSRYWFLSGARAVARTTHANVFAQALVGVGRAPDGTGEDDRFSYQPSWEPGFGLDVNFNQDVGMRFAAGRRYEYRAHDPRWEWRFTNGLVWRFNRSE